jgi:hypothetical protein
LFVVPEAWHSHANAPCVQNVFSDVKAEGEEGTEQLASGKRAREEEVESGLA